MIKPERRLSNDKQVERVLQKGASASGSFFRVKALKNPRLKISSRVAVIVGKKVSNKATCRNRIKRRAKAVFIKESAKIEGYDLAVFPNKNTKDADFDKLTSDARQCLKKLVSF